MYFDPRCSNCEVYGYCTQTEEECGAYQEFLSWRKEEYVHDCQSCEVQGFCSGSDEECEAYSDFYGWFNKTLPIQPVNFSGSSTLKVTNQGLINWLKGPIIDIVEGDFMAQVTIQVGDNCITSIMPKEKFITSNKKIGDVITVAIKSFNVKMMR
jgi:molybdopterin-binding protein